MPRYMALILDDNTAWGEPGAYERGLQLHSDFGRDFADVLRGGEALNPPADAKVVRAEGEGFVVTDGPFTETKETVGGYYLFEVPDEAAALAVAQRVPVLRGVVELRQIMEFD